jgi:hypothetical protein
MRKMILTLAVMIGLPAIHAHAQGTVNFGNNSSTAITNPFTMMRVVAGTTFQVSLYYLPDGPEPTTEAMLSQAIRIGANAPIAPAAGLYAGGTRTTPPTTPGAGFAWFQVRIWEAAFGSSYEAVVANCVPQNGRFGLAGTSNIIRVKTGDPVNNIPPGSLIGLQPFIIAEACVPEPSSIALAALGLGTLVLLRRRKNPGLDGSSHP